MYNHFWKEPRNEKTFTGDAVSWEIDWWEELRRDVRRHRGQSPSVIECHNLLGGCDTRLHLDFDPIGCDRKINPSKRSEICVCDVTELWEIAIAMHNVEATRDRVAPIAKFRVQQAAPYPMHFFLLKSRLQSHFVEVNCGVFWWWD